MEEEVGILCDIVCSDDFKCHWAKSDQRVRYMFPDGTSQTCVGAQVRCGCTFTMSLISNITYEHPTAVVLSFIFISTFVVYMILRCIVLRKCLCCCGSAKSKPKTCSTCSLPSPRDVAISSAFNMNSGSSSSTSSSSNNLASGSPPPGPSQHSIHFVYKDKPPTYSKVVSEPETCRYEDLPPPSYSECLKQANNSGDAILHI